MLENLVDLDDETHWNHRRHYTRAEQMIEQMRFKEN